MACSRPCSTFTSCTSGRTLRSSANVPVVVTGLLHARGAAGDESQHEHQRQGKRVAGVVCDRAFFLES